MCWNSHIDFAIHCEISFVSLCQSDLQKKVCFLALGLCNVYPSGNVHLNVYLQIQCIFLCIYNIYCIWKCSSMNMCYKYCWHMKSFRVQKKCLGMHYIYNCLRNGFETNCVCVLGLAQPTLYKHITLCFSFGAFLLGDALQIASLFWAFHAILNQTNPEPVSAYTPRDTPPFDIDTHI